MKRTSGGLLIRRCVVCVVGLLALAACNESAAPEKAKTGISDADKQVMQQAAERLHQSMPDPGLKTGEQAPDFSLPDADGKIVSLHDRLAQGPVVLIFYRGGWCPFCNLQLKQFRDALPQLQALGAQLIAISPQKPDKTREQFKQAPPGFDVLSDLDGDTLKAYRLYYEVDPALLAVYKRNGLDLEAYNGTGRTLLPVSATFVIDAKGVVVDRYADTDYTKRMRPEQAIQALQALQTPPPAAITSPAAAAGAAGE